MAAVLMPAVRTAVPAIAAKLPGMLQYVKAKLPDAYQAVSAYVGDSGRTPEAVVKDAAAQKNAFLTQSVLETFLKNGVPVNVLTQTIPMLSAEELNQLQLVAISVDRQERAQTSARAVKIEGVDPTLLLAIKMKKIRKWRGRLGMTADEFAEYLADVQGGLTAQDCEQVEQFLVASGRASL